jgi:hypothetical protein
MLGVETEEWACHNGSHLRTIGKATTRAACQQTYCFHTNEVFANHSKEDKQYPLTTEEIAEAQRADASLKHLFKRKAVIDQELEIKLIEKTLVSAKMVG